MQSDITTKQLRSFGFTVGGIFGILAIYPAVIHGAEMRWWAALVGACLIVPAFIVPNSLFWIHKGWMMLGHVLGWVNTRIILSIVFYLVITPLGTVRSWLGKDPMGRRLRADVDS